MKQNNILKLSNGDIILAIMLAMNILQFILFALIRNFSVFKTGDKPLPLNQEQARFTDN